MADSNFEWKKLHKMNQGSSSLGGSLSKGTMQELQSNLNENDSPSILESDLSSGTDPSIFTSKAPE